MINEEESRSKSAKQHGLSSICVLKINRTAPQPVLPKAHLVPGKSGTVNTEKTKAEKIETHPELFCFICRFDSLDTEGNNSSAKYTF